MNIFFLDHDIETSVSYYCDQHVVKMTTEYAQMLSTAHRVLDGKFVVGKNAKGRKISFWKHDTLDDVLMKSTHVNHPQNIWIRDSIEHYNYLYDIYVATCKEYTKRYDKIHKSSRLIDLLADAPKNIDRDAGWKNPPLTMPEEYFNEDYIKAYRDFYIYDKSKFARYYHSEKPYWLVSPNELIAA